MTKIKSNWITGKEVMKMLGCNDYDLLEYRRKGLLIPYTKDFSVYGGQNIDIEKLMKSLPSHESFQVFPEGTPKDNAIEAYGGMFGEKIRKEQRKALPKCLYEREKVLEFRKEHSLHQPDDKITEEPISKKNVFRQEGPTWAITYEGKELRGLRGKGFELVHYLILHERKVFHIDELRIEFNKTLPNEEKSLMEIDLDHSDDDREAIKGGIDSRAKIYGKSMEELKEHRAYLQDEIRKADTDNDPAQKAKFETEFKEFEKYCTEFFGLKGRSRKDRDNTIKTKDRICKRIERALNNLREYDKNTWRHFHNALRPINSYLQSYQPDRDIDWLTK